MSDLPCMLSVVSFRCPYRKHYAIFPPIHIFRQLFIVDELKFEFLKHFLTRCEHKGKNMFVEKKKQYIQDRRMALKAKDSAAYAKIVVGMINEEEKNMNEIINAALK